jgi:hypothetical protein
VLAQPGQPVGLAWWLHPGCGQDRKEIYAKPSQIKSRDRLIRPLGVARSEPSREAKDGC